MNLLQNDIYLKELNETVNSFPHWNKFENTSVLITGANGLISSYFVDVLMMYGKTDVYAMIRDKEKAEKRFLEYLDNPRFHIIIQDVCHPFNTDITFDYIIHAASNAHPLAFSTEPVATMKANLTGTINMLDYAVTHMPKKFLFISSAEIYGSNNSTAEHGLSEDYCGCVDCNDPRSCYPESKRAGETLCAAYARNYPGLAVATARPGFIYGPSMNHGSSKADAQFIRKSVAGEDIIMKSAGTLVRSYVYNSDFTSALLYILLFGENGGAYNIAGKEVTSLREFAEACAKIAGTKVVFENPDDVEAAGYSKAGNGVLNADKLESLGWKAKFSLCDGLKRTVDILKN